MKEQSEKDIQRTLAANLHLLEPGLKCEKMEYYLKAPPYGTKGFIDILAKDRDGNTLIIEIKSRRSTTREAIHELLKYAEHLKWDKGVNDDELRLCIVSTDWTELLIPFSSAYAKMDVNLEGYWLHVSDSGEILSVERIRPLKMMAERVLSDCHLTLWCQSAEDVSDALQIVQSNFGEYGVTQYVVAVLQAPEGFAEAERELIRKQMENIGLSPASLAQYCSPAYGLCIASQKRTKEECLQIIEGSSYLSERFEKEFYSHLDYAPEYYLHNMTFYSPIWACVSNGIECELTQPSHFRVRLEEEGWQIRQFIRGASFSDAKLLLDEILLDELKGVSSSAADERLYKQQLNSRNRAGIQKACKNLKKVLALNHFWRLPLITELENMCDPEEGMISGKLLVFDPMSVLRYLYLYSVDEEPLSLLPKSSLSYAYVNLEEDSISFVRYTCILEKVRKSLSFESILEKYYQGNNRILRSAAAYDGYREDNSEIVYDLGFEYRVYRETTINPGPISVRDRKISYLSVFNQPTVFEQYDDAHDRFLPCGSQSDYYQLSFKKFLEEEPQFMSKLQQTLDGTEQPIFET